MPYRDGFAEDDVNPGDAVERLGRTRREGQLGGSTRRRSSVEGREAVWSPATARPRRNRAPGRPPDSSSRGAGELDVGKRLSDVFLQLVRRRNIKERQSVPRAGRLRG
jgi:hypothetical protein